ncbi:hypothetical protein ACFOLJ_00010 [Rugamonas sp. CCM 8940]
MFDISQHYEASMVAHKLLAALSAPFLIGGHDLRVGGSIGISVYPQTAATPKPCCGWPTSPCTAPSKAAATPTATMSPSTART